MRFNILCLNPQKLKEKTQAASEQEADKKSILAYRAYQQWLTNKKLKEKELVTERLVEEELDAHRQEQRRRETARAKDSFTSWKKKKDMEAKLRKENELEWRGGSVGLCVSPSPTLAGGYCSVWACDDQLADHVSAKVPRQHEAPPNMD